MADKTPVRTARDEEIVSQVLAGNREAYGELVRRYWPASVAVALSRVGNMTEAEEAAQEGFVAAYQHLSTLRDPGRFAAWLAKIVRQKSADRVRSRAREKRRFVSVDTVELECAASGNPGLAPDELSRTREAVMELPEKLRRVVLLRYVAGLSGAEIAETLGIKPGTARMWLHRAYGKLRKKLSAVIEEAGR